MKKSKKIILIVFAFLLFYSCKKDDPKPAVLSSLSVKTAPAKVSYYTGDVLGLSGLVVKLTMDNGTTEDVSFSNFAGKGISCSPANGAELTTASTAVTIKHTATGKNVSQPITVKDVVVTGITVKTAPAKVSYYAGETLELSGLVVKLSMNNGTTEDVSFSNFTGKGINCSPANGTVLTASSTEVTITHTVSGKSASQAITFITLTDADGNTYGLVKIGSQIWMAENLKTTHYANGIAIQLIESSTAWNTLGNADKAMCYYGNSTANKDTYGALYTWAAAMNGTTSSSANPSGVQGACPDGWHLPSDDEWKQLEMYLGMSQADADVTGWRGTNEGSKLAGNSGLWSNGTLENDAAFGTSGFLAFPAGHRYNNGTFYSLSDYAYFWSATESAGSRAWSRCLLYSSSGVSRYNYGYKDNGFSVRCLKD